MPKLFRLAALTASLVALLCACGQKGPLYLPSEEPPKKQSD
ncbi:MAG: lipoprotein [Chromatiales bacterium]|nr:lipoprotein [Chromatiales bacterium]